MSSRKNRSPEEHARRAKRRELLQESNISSMEDMIANPERYQDALTAAKELIRRGKDCCPMMEQIMEERMQEC